MQWRTEHSEVTTNPFVAGLGIIRVLTSSFDHYLADFDHYLRAFFASQPPLPSDFDLMLRYALGWVDENGQTHNTPTGKRIRPVLLMLCTETSGGDWRSALPGAAAVELLHNFSLIHDDIQDNSPLRHNRPTVWKIWGSPNAINAGDALFTLAYTALEQLGSSGMTPENVIKVWHIFNYTALELTRGQHLDMRFERQSDVSVNEYISMITGKSAALLAACAQIGSLIASPDENAAYHYSNFGLNIGIAFQIHDDILGIWGNSSITGKSVATDILSRKKSLPVLYGLDQSPELQALYQRQLFTEADVNEVVDILNRVEAQDYAYEQEDLYYQKAIKALEATNPQGQSAEKLMRLIEGLFKRTH